MQLLQESSDENPVELKKMENPCDLKIVDKLDLANEEGVTMIEIDGCAGSAVMETSHC